MIDLIFLFIKAGFNLSLDENSHKISDKSK